MRTAICVYVRDEQRDIAEWIAFHHVVGFDTVILFDNMSRDRTATIARHMGRNRDVRVVPWPWPFRYGQAGAYIACLKLFGRSFDWIAFVDSDEFVLPRNGLSISDVLTPLENAEAVALNYAFFGSSGLVDYPDGLVIENFTNRAPDDFPPNAMVKSIVRPRSAHYLNVHAFRVDGGYAGPSGRPASWSEAMDRTLVRDVSTAQVNHYFTRSRAHWADKLARGYRAPIKRGEADFIAYDRNEVEDLEAAALAASVHTELRVHNLPNYGELP